MEPSTNVLAVALISLIAAISPGIVGKIDQYRIYVDRVMGGIFMLLGFKMLFI